MARLTVIGGGFMGSAIVEGLIDSGWPPSEIIVAEVREARRQHLVDHLKVTVTDDAADAVRQTPTVIFAIKPQDVEGALRKIRGGYPLDNLTISVCAGISIDTFESMLGDVPVIRCMPNTPAAIGLGATAIARGRHASDQNLATALNILATVGKVVVVDENQMDAVTAVSGTGPAYLFYVAEAMIRAAEDEGLTTEQAYLLVYQTMHGAARLLRHDPAGPAELRRRVTSPGGTTHAAITYLESKEWERTFREAIHEARKRSEELGRRD